MTIYLIRSSVRGDSYDNDYISEYYTVELEAKVRCYHLNKEYDEHYYSYYPLQPGPPVTLPPKKQQ